MTAGYWRHVLDSDMALPQGRPLNELTAELVTMLGSPHPVERDEVAYPVLTTWLAEGLYDDLLVTVGDALLQGLRQGLGGDGDDTVFRRSFSARVLAACIDRDNRCHLLPVDTVVRWADGAVTWYTRERDLRGFVDGKGSAHTVAYGADLINVLAQSRHLAATHLNVLLDVIAERLATSTTHTFVDGEDDRLSAAALTVLQRNLLGHPELEGWLDTLATGVTRPDQWNDAIWPSPSARNISAFLRALYVHLAIGVRPADSTLSFAEAPDHRADLLLALLAVIPRSTPSLYSTASLTR